MRTSPPIRCLVLLLALPAGCEGDSLLPVLTSEGFARTVVELDCAWQLRCNAQYGLPAMDVKACVNTALRHDALYRAAVRGEWGSYGGGEACLGALADRACDQRPNWALQCPEVVVGRGAKHACCDTHWVCESGRCGQNGCEPAAKLGAACGEDAGELPCAARYQCVAGVCVPWQSLAAGESCDDAYACFPHLRCIDGTCQPPAGVGAPCDGQSCSRELFCSSEQGVCSAPPGLGESCEEAGWRCAPNLKCGSGGVCIPNLALGAACTDHEPCSPGWCNAGHCAALPGLSEPCTVELGCNAASQCDPATLRCTSLLGAACESEAWCSPAGLTCLAGHCASPGGVGAACENALNCDPALLCDAAPGQCASPSVDTCLGL